MAGVRLDQHGITAFLNSPGVSGFMAEVGKVVMDDAKVIMAGMGAVDTGAMRDSGKVEAGQGATTVSFNTDYAAIVHEGLGLGRNASPRPYLTKAAYKRRSL